MGAVGGIGVGARRGGAGAVAAGVAADAREWAAGAPIFLCKR